MTLNMFMVFVKQFNILGQQQRKITEKNDLERKRRGIIQEIDDVVNSQSKSQPSKELLDYHDYEIRKINKLKKPYEKIESKHKWWKEEDEFYKYYNPQNIGEKPPTYKVLDTMSLMQIFKKNTFMGKTCGYDNFKRLLTVLAQRVYPNDDPEQNDLSLRFFIEVL